MTFFEEINNDSLAGVALKNINIKKAVISYFANTGNSTIADLCKELALSAPKVNNILNDLLADGLVKDYGKVESTGGRKPNIYGLVAESAFFIGVDVKKTHINIGLSDLKKNIIKYTEHLPYQLANTQESLDELYELIRNFIKSLKTPKDKILGIGINLSGRINYTTGNSYNAFHFNKKPLNKIMENSLGIKVFLENDSNAMAFGEFSSGVVNGEKNVLFLNVDYGLGLGIIINNQLYYGKSGFAGEFGHIPMFKNEVLCYCGKKGCLETEASGNYLLRMFKEKLASGLASSININPKNIQLEDIIKAVNQDDTLAIETLADMADNLGRGIALLINIFNPELIVIGGSLAATGDYLRLPIRSAINKYSLSLVNVDTKIQISQLGEKSGVVGACLLSRNRVFNIA
ncbi:ROK family transcriptional regulator [Pedobacter glucosidilyticus]|uniref:ROK family transcriptional regulator n=1 Tax=Pedobacter glucosidilyticus TaxID=1122941 RepID=UPI0004241136|nr:ROK family transcriptional regulator [Pedobacter glucosidilyticus]